MDDDVRSVLRALLSANGLSVVFRPGISGKVSFKFQDADPAAAFGQLLTENGLEASYNDAARTVTIGPAHGNAGTLAQRFIPLGSVDYGALRQMLVNFGIGTEGITYDPSVGMLGVSGDATRISQVSDLVKALADHMAAREDRTLETQQRAAAVQRSTYQARAYEDVMNVQTRVFRLRFADVVPTVRQFHGRTVTVPGVLDTLQSMLGLTSGGGGAQADPSRQGYAAFRPAAPLRQLQQLTQSTDAAVGTAGQPSDDGRPGLVQPIGRPTISVDARTNSIIVRGSPAAIAAVEDVLRQLDQPVKMVEIEVVIATAQIGVSQEIGIAFRGLRGTSAFDTGTTGNALSSSPLLDPTTLLPLAAGPQATVASFVTRGGQLALQAQLKLLAEKNKARVLSAPHLVTMDNVTARITRSQDLYVPVDTGGLNGQGLSQIQTGLTLEITPSIVPPSRGSGDQMVRLNLNAVNSAPGAGLTSQQVSVSSQEVQTDVLVPDGGTFVVGGLFDDTRTRSRSGVPVLKDIPLIGGLFRDDSSLANLGETIFFITPRVIEQREVQRRDIADADAAGLPIAEVNAGRRALGGMIGEMGGRSPQRARDIEEDE